MANTLFKFDRNSDAMRPKVRALDMLQEAVALLTTERAIELMRRGDTDGSDPTHYAALASAGAFTLSANYATANEAAKACFEQLDDLWFKLTTNASISDMSAAISNTCAKLGV